MYIPQASFESMLHCRSHTGSVGTPNRYNNTVQLLLLGCCSLLSLQSLPLLFLSSPKSEKRKWLDLQSSDLYSNQESVTRHNHHSDMLGTTIIQIPLLSSSCAVFLATFTLTPHPKTTNFTRLFKPTHVH